MSKGYYYSEKSMAQLESCELDIQRIFKEAIKHVDITIIEGVRSKERQNELYRQGKSQLQWPDGKHNIEPEKGEVKSRAIDAAPYPIDWNDRERATLFAGFILGIAAQMGIKLRWGGDWDSDWQVKDNNFDDLWHFELV